MRDSPLSTSFAMALPKLPSLAEIWENPSILTTLPTPIAEAILERFRQVEQTVSGALNVPPTPIELAIAHPKFHWMDTAHLHYLGDEIAAAVDSCGAIIVTMPPRHAKTHTCSVWTPFWYLAKYPDRQILFISYEAKFARKWGVKVRGLIEMYGAAYGLYLDPKQTSGDDWALTTGGGMKTVGAGGGIAGNPAKLLIIDDAIKGVDEARSDLLREQLWDWWEGTVMQRIEPDTTVIVIGTRYHEDDLIGRMLQASAAGTGLKFEEVSLRAMAEADDPIGREPGTGLWTDHPLAGGKVWGQEYYDKKKASVSAYVWHATFQQRPSPPKGNKVDPAWWRTILPQDLPVHFDQEAQSWDLALDAEKKSDSYHAGLVGSRAGANIYLRAGYHRHGKIAAGIDPATNDAEDTVISQIRVWNVRYPGAQTKLVERAIAGPMLINTLQYEIPGMTPWPPKGARKGSKEANLDACSPTIRSGNVYIVLNPDGSMPQWASEFIEELRQFPNAPNDDYVDTFSQLMAFFLPGVRAAIGIDHKEALARRPATSPQEEATAALHSLLKRLAKPKIEAMRRQWKTQERDAKIPYGAVNTGIYARGGAGRRRGPIGLC